jgi:cysteine desulfurase
VIYLDHAATSPLLPEVAEAMREWLGVPANPSSVHAAGRRAAAAVDRARVEVAALLDRDPAGIVFGSGATEANHAAIRGFVELGARRVLVSPVEHPSVYGALERAASSASSGPAAIQWTRMDIGPDGITRVPDPDPSSASGLREPGAAADLVVLMAVNHEIGTVQPVRSVAEVLRPGARLHVDATQAAGRIPLQGLPADSIALSAHKLGGPVGVGALSLRDGAPFPALLTGGSQERGHRAGTVNVAGVVGFGVACRIAREQLEARQARGSALAERLRAGLVAFGGRLVGADPIPAITCVVFDDLPGETLVQALDLRGVAVSSGAACASGSVGPSPVLRALAEPNARGGVRISLGPASTAEDIEGVLAALAAALPPIREAARWETEGSRV